MRKLTKKNFTSTIEILENVFFDKTNFIKLNDGEVLFRLDDKEYQRLKDFCNKTLLDTKNIYAIKYKELQEIGFNDYLIYISLDSKDEVYKKINSEIFETMLVSMLVIGYLK